MFKQVCKARTTSGFIFAAYIVPNADGNDGGLMIFVYDHSKTII